MPLMMVLAGCGDPMQNVARLADQDVAEDAPTLGAVPAVETPESDRVGLFARLLGGGQAGESAQDKAATADAPATGDAPVEASLPADTAPPEGEDPDNRAPAKRRGFLASLLSGGGGASGRGQVASEIEYGTVLPYGEVKRICGLRSGQMGKVVAQYPETRPLHKVYDSDPGNTGPHTFYVTGFDDRCARQFTASLAMFGSVEMHERLRYGLPAKVQPYSATDKAYEDVKARVCRVPRKKPCGQRVGRLADDTVFLSIYERFGGNSQWKNLLLHSGEMVAKDKKGG
ncbi:hypothetical protein [Roseovarius sp. MMSF_3281]|uniref:hypothetical protein n=1 Tax=Roseovarius sp. MMSF_3281 TaxID=3046694 RepID=UPI00273F09B4|nr:hypothetical protein [Roseovarius sp. MMSF_3281]